MAAIAALLTGAITWLAALMLELTNVPYVLAVALAAAAYVVASLMSSSTRA